MDIFKKEVSVVGKHISGRIKPNWSTKFEHGFRIEKVFKQVHTSEDLGDFIAELQKIKDELERLDADHRTEKREKE